MPRRRRPGTCTSAPRPVADSILHDERQRLFRVLEGLAVIGVRRRRGRQRHAGQLVSHNSLVGVYLRLAAWDAADAAAVDSGLGGRRVRWACCTRRWRQRVRLYSRRWQSASCAPTAGKRLTKHDARNARRCRTGCDSCSRRRRRNGDMAIPVRDVRKQLSSQTNPRAAAEHEEEIPAPALQSPPSVTPMAGSWPVMSAAVDE